MLREVWCQGSPVNMETRLEKLQSQKFLLISLIVTGISFLIAGSFGKETAIVFGNWIFVLSAAPVILTAIMIKRKGIQGIHGKSWVCFLIFAVLWCIADQLFTYNELYLHESPFPSSADVFYLAGYPFYLLFVLNYLKPFKNAISKKLLLSVSLIATVVLITNVYMTLQNNSPDETQTGVIVGLIYPIADAIILVPTIIGVTLFFRGMVNFLWTLLLIGFICEVIGDTAFQYLSLSNDMYTGHPIDLLFLWTYILFSFGIYDHLKIFKSQKNSFDNKEDLR
ncbi:MAG TPA: hypothetical protein VEJ68_02215 [Candidatus Bathyarchaeia archaeon]|nr:hypothetical protein [Candidatus Bathyarchaeia archaeon]